MNVMLTLMRKDWRMFRAPAVGAIVLGLGPYALALLFILIESRRQRSLPSAEDWLDIGETMSIASIACLAVVGAAFGGMAWAAERADRSADFLALLPPARWQHAVSKATVAAAWLAAWAAADVAVGVAAADHVRPSGGAPYPTPAIYLWTAAGIGCYAVAAFGVAWACSTVLTSSAISAVVGICGGVALFVGIGMTSIGRPWPAGLWAASSLSVGTVMFLVGTAWQLTRVKP